MKILCAYFNEEIDYLCPEPDHELIGHEVVSVHGFDEAVLLIEDTSGRMPPFDIVLADILLPKSEKLTHELGPGGVLLMMHASKYLGRGLGIFVPKQFESVFVIDMDDYQAVVASRECWTPAGKRDWRRLLQIVVEEIRKIDQS